jgi:hypothetical protein
MSDTFNLDRKMNMDNNIDPNGRKWNIVHIKGTALYTARPEPYRDDIVFPDEFKGRWTKPTLLDKQIKLYLTRAWNKADEATAKSERRIQAAKEAKKKREVASDKE